MRFFLTILPFFLIAGCGDLATQTERAEETLAETEQEIAAKTAEMPALPAESPQQLAEAFRIAYLRGDTDSISQMIYWGDQTPDERTLGVNYLGRTASKGPGKTMTVEVGEPEEGLFANSNNTLKPTLVLRGQYRRNDDSGSVGGSLRYPIGEIDGKFYFSIPKK